MEQIYKRLIRRSLYVCYVLVILVSTNESLKSQIVDDFQVNENGGWCDHVDPQIAMHVDGSFIIVWHA